MADQFSETSVTSWGKRIAGAFVGIIFGIGLFIGSFFLLSWNEGRSVRRIKTLAEGRDLVVSVDSQNVDPTNENKLVHSSGLANTDETLKDAYFGIEQNALKLRRVVEMYQWEQSSEKKTEKKLGGSEETTTVYTYKKVWSEKQIKSSDFKKPEGHKNPNAMPYKSQTWTAQQVQMGAFSLTSPFISKIDQFNSYPLSEENFQNADDAVKANFKLENGMYYSGKDSNEPEIGDLQIQYKIITPSVVSAIGQQRGANLTSYTTKNGQIDLLQYGNVTADSMFAKAEQENTLFTWLIRLGGCAMMWIGLILMLGPVKVLGDIVPLIGNLLGAGIALIAGLVAIALSFVTIAVAWIAYRPILGGALLIVAAATTFFGYKTIHKKALKPI
ncbi:MAG: TMEM43 family protein [Bdellovibrionota bacterium]